VVGDVLGNTQQIFRYPWFVTDGDLAGVEWALSLGLRVDRLFPDVNHAGLAQDLAVLGGEGFCLFARREIKIRLADQYFAGRADQFLARTVEQGEAKVLSILLLDHVRDVFDNGVEV